VYSNIFHKSIIFFALVFLTVTLSGQADLGCPTVLVDINDPSTLPSLPASTCIGDSLEICFETDCPTCDFSDVTLGYTINTTTDPGFTSFGDGFGALCFQTVVPESDGDPCQSYDLEITLSTLNTNDPNCSSTNIGYDIDAGFPLQGNDINTIIPLLANFDANPLVVTVHPQYTVVIESPSCDGTAGFAVVQTNGIDCFGPVAGTAGAPNVCPDGVAINAVLDYDFRTDVDTAACVTGSLSGTISLDCFESCNAGCTDPLACNYSSNATSDDGSCVLLDAGTISTTDNTTICTGDGNDAIVTVTVNGNVGPGYGYIITEATGTTILGQSGTGSFNLEGAPTGTCLIWGIANYTDFDILTDQVADLVGCYVLSNSIEVTREPAGCTDANACNFDANAFCDDGSCFYVESGTVSTTDVTTICTGDGITDTITAVATGGVGSNILYIITTGDGVEILASNDTGIFDLEGAPAGNCLIWAIHYESLSFPTAFVADMTGCFALSNSIEVIRESVGCTDPTACNFDVNAGCDNGSCVYAVGGVISSNDPLTICSGDGTSDDVSIIVNGNQGSNYIYLVTDEAGTTILASNDTGVFDFEGVEAGTYILWGVAFENINIPSDQVADITGCFDLSNPLEIIRQRAGCTNPNACNYDINAECEGPCFFVDGGTLATSDVTTICTGDGNDAIVNASVTGEIGTNYLYVVTDVSATTILASDSTGTFNFEGGPAGVCLIWGIAYESINISSDQIADITGCYAFSDAIQIDREQAGCTDQSACNYDTNAACDDGSCQPGPCNPGCTDLCAPNFDESADADNGSCETYSTDCTSFDDCYTIYGWSVASCSCVPFEAIDYDCNDNDDCTADSFDEGNCNCVNAPIDGCGDVLGCTDPFACNYDSAANTDDGSCILVDPGFLDTNDNTIICTGDGNNDVINLIVTENLGPNYMFILTDENATTILATDTIGVFDLEGAPPGVCLIWGVAYLDINIPSDDLFEIEGCFAFSDPLEVIREQAGCTDATACNYDVNAECDDGSCQAAPCNPGCTDPCAPNFSASADADDGSCEVYDTCPANTCFSEYTWDAQTCSCLETAIDYFCDDQNDCTVDDVDPETCECRFTQIEGCFDCNDPCGGDNPAINVPWLAELIGQSYSLCSVVRYNFNGEWLYYMEYEGSQLIADWASGAIYDCDGNVICTNGGFTLIEAQCSYQGYNLSLLTYGEIVYQGDCVYPAGMPAIENECVPDCLCPAVVDPVCGVNGVTYGNACQAACAGVEVDISGECPSCVCDLDDYNPVCGEDGNTYSNACEANCAGVVVASNGFCGGGCTDPKACNYNENATFDDGSCLVTGCNPGCTDPCAPNFDIMADQDDGSCSKYPKECPISDCFTTYIWSTETCECISSTADYDCNDNDDCTTDALDEITCECTNIIIDNCNEVAGCIDPCAPNFNVNANTDDGSCDNYNTSCNSDCSLGAITAWVEASCECLPVPSSAGCTDPASCNYDPDVVCDDGSCEYVTCSTLGCTDPCSINYNAQAIGDDGSCVVYDSYCNTDCDFGPIEAWNPETCSCEALPNNMCDDPDCVDFQVIYNVICSPEKDTYEVLISMFGGANDSYLILDNNSGIVYGPIAAQNITLGSYNVPDGYSFTVSVASHPECSIDIGMTYVDCITTDIELTRFAGLAKPEGNLLNWTTANENNSKMFILEHSLNGVEFEQVATVLAAGNSNVSQTYSYFDSQRENGNHYYRLQEVRSNNSVRIVSEVIVINRVMDLSIINIYPVPVRDLLNIEINTDQKEDLVVKLYDISGRIVYERHVVSEVGNNKITIFAGELAIGNYFIKIYSQNVNVVEKFVKK